MREQIIKNVYQKKLIAIVRGMEEKKIVPLAKALYEGGIDMIEVTFNQSNPEQFVSVKRAIEAIRSALGSDVYTGAGTVMSNEQLHIAADAGAQYIISPHTNTELIKKTKEMGLVSMPGATTASEAQAAYEAGADFVKLFPASILGVSYLKALRAPLSHIPFLCVGGMNEQNIGEYLSAGAVGFGIGGNLVSKNWVDSGKFDQITALARKYVDAVHGEAVEV